MCHYASEKGFADFTLKMHQKREGKKMENLAPMSFQKVGAAAPMLNPRTKRS